ncbi:UPF0598 protein CG30010 [Agrilus planipennis]|uniref:UPF0598 protein CG30010 n=1 Tax=Agrilus planipennis TaxID=224129 RepID=A0A7F5RAL2_AGRPL|nr:UPF0598 protein CG30010-like [Agrilus planipennis]XP_025833021.1 UPF0598 protein CG30010 [Agrilus planipennis]
MSAITLGRVFCLKKLPLFVRRISYVQGQEPEPKVREYFYYIDHQGMLFLDDSKMKNFTSCFKEKKFLQFFFSRLKINNTQRYPQFPYISPCGKERNFVRCDDYPFVYTQVVKKVNNEGKQEDYLSYNHAAELLTLNFLPEKIFMLPCNGRVYYPAPERAGSIGLVMSKLAIEFSKYFIFDRGEHNPPTHFTWNEHTYTLDNKWYYDALRNKEQQQIVNM